MVAKNSVSTTSVAVLAFTLFCAQVYLPGTGTKFAVPASTQPSESIPIPEIVIPKEDGLAGLERLDSARVDQEIIEITRSGGLSLADHSYSAIAKRSPMGPKSSPVNPTQKTSGQMLQKTVKPKAIHSPGKVTYVNDAPSMEELSKFAMQHGSTMSSSNKAIFSSSNTLTAVLLMLLALVGAIVFFTDTKEMMREEKSKKTLKLEKEAVSGGYLKEEDSLREKIEKKSKTAWFDLTLSDDAEYEDEWLGSPHSEGQEQCLQEDGEEECLGSAREQSQEQCLHESSKDILCANTDRALEHKAVQHTWITSLPLWVPPVVVLNIAIHIYRVITQLQPVWPEEQLAQDADTELEALAALPGGTHKYLEVPTSLVFGALITLAALGSAVFCFDVRTAMHEQEEAKSKAQNMGKEEVDRKDVSAQDVSQAAHVDQAASPPSYCTSITGLSTPLLIALLGILFGVLGSPQNSIWHVKHEVRQAATEELLALTPASNGALLPSGVVLAFLACAVLLGVVLFFFDLHAAMEEEALKEAPKESAPCSKDSKIPSTSNTMWFDMTATDESEYEKEWMGSDSQNPADVGALESVDTVQEEDLQGSGIMQLLTCAPFLLALCLMLISMLGAPALPACNHFSVNPSCATYMQQEVAQPAYEELLALSAHHGGSSSTSAPTSMILAIVAVLTSLGAAVFYEDVQTAIEEEMEVDSTHQAAGATDDVKDEVLKEQGSSSMALLVCAPFVLALCLMLISMLGAPALPACNHFSVGPSCATSMQQEVAQPAYEELLALSARYGGSSSMSAPTSMILAIVAVLTSIGAAVFYKDVQTAIEEEMEVDSTNPAAKANDDVKDEVQGEDQQGSSSMLLLVCAPFLLALALMLISMLGAPALPACHHFSANPSCMVNLQQDIPQPAYDELLALAARHGGSSSTSAPANMILATIAAFVILGAAVFCKDVQTAIEEETEVVESQDACQPDSQVGSANQEAEGTLEDADKVQEEDQQRSSSMPVLVCAPFLLALALLLISMLGTPAMPACNHFSVNPSCMVNMQQEAPQLAYDELLALSNVTSHQLQVPNSVAIISCMVMVFLGAGAFLIDLQTAIDDENEIFHEEEKEPAAGEEKEPAEGDESDDADSTDEGASSQSEDSEEQ